MPVNAILLPGEHDRGELVSAMAGCGIRFVDIDLPSAHPAPFATRVCAAIGAARPASPVVIVAPPASAPHLPAIALAQRSAHRRVTGYVILEPGLIQTGSIPTGVDWPDAPVACLSMGVTEPAWVSLRGWQGLLIDSWAQAAAVIAAWEDGTSFPSANAIDQFR